eukprot:2563812-Lingulodinium_polyedra.AAC.1
MSFGIRQHGYKVAMAMAQEWCHRMSFFFELFEEEGTGSKVYQQADLATYQPSEGWAEVVASLPAGSPSAERAARLNAMIPG